MTRLPGSARVSTERHRFAGPLDPSHKMRPNCVIFIFIWSWAAERRHSGAPRAHGASRLSLHAFIWKREMSASPGMYTLAHISRFCARRLAGPTVIFTWPCLSERNMGGRSVVTWSSRDRRTICSVRATAEMNRERSGACVPLDLISPTCPCHSDSQPRCAAFCGDASVAAGH